MLKYLFKIILIIIICSYTFAEEKNEKKEFKWRKISGQWAFSHSQNYNYIFDQRLRAHDFGFSELINNCSLISTKTAVKKILNSDQFKAVFKLFNQKPANNFMFFFSATSYKNFYGIRFYGNKKSINKVSLIRSVIKDTTKPVSAKWNFEIIEIESKPVKLDFNKVYTLDVQLKGKRVKAFIDNNLLLEKSLKEKLPTGRFGISHENNLIQVIDVKAFNNKKLVFEDDFSKNSVYERKFKAVRVKKDKDKKSK